MAISKIIYDKDIFTRIFQYLEKDELKKIGKQFRNKLHYNYIYPTEHILLFGAVQSGKTSKIIKFINNYKPNMVKIFIIQNNLTMMKQMIKALNDNDIICKTIFKQNAKTHYNGERVLIVIQNKFRINAIHTYLKYNANKITKYALIMDESDQYYNKLKNAYVVKYAKYILHVTATPYSYKKELQLFDNVVTIKPKNTYVGFDNVEIKTIISENLTNSDKIIHVTNIIQNDFIQKQHGLMLINCFSLISNMIRVARILSNLYTSMPIVILSTKTLIWKNGKSYPFKLITIQKLIDSLNNHKHIIFIANRYSNRGINYTDSAYRRTITHQISAQNNNHTNFIQKCRIFGNRTHIDYKPVLYCIALSTSYIDTNLKRYLNKVQTVVNPIAQYEPFEPFEQTHLNISTLLLKDLKNICKQHNIKGYSNKKKAQIIQMIQQAGIICTT